MSKVEYVSIRHVMNDHQPAPPAEPARIAAMLSPPLRAALQAIGRGGAANYSARAALRFLRCIEFSGELTPLGGDVLSVLESA